MKSVFVALLLGLAAAQAADKTVVTTEKPDYLGRKKTEFKNTSGRKIGEARTETKEDYLGRTKTKVKGETPLETQRSR